jgi:hypothetical protein
MRLVNKREKLLETTWSVWLEGSEEEQRYVVRGGTLWVNLPTRVSVGSVVDNRDKWVAVQPNKIVDEKLYFYLDGKPSMVFPGGITDLRICYEVKGPYGVAIMDATWHLRLISARYV